MCQIGQSQSNTSCCIYTISGKDQLFLGAKQFAFMTSQMGQSHLRTSFYVSMMLQMYQFHLGNSWDVSAMPLVSYSSLTYQLLHLYDL